MRNKKQYLILLKQILCSPAFSELNGSTKQLLVNVFVDLIKPHTFGGTSIAVVLLATVHIGIIICALVYPHLSESPLFPAIIAFNIKILMYLIGEK